MRPEVEATVKSFLKALSKKIRIEKAYIFGSSVRGDWLKTSDIDLVIVSKDFENIPFLKRLELVEETQWKEKIRPHIETIPLTPEEFKEKVKSIAILRRLKILDKHTDPTPLKPIRKPNPPPVFYP